MRLFCWICKKSVSNELPEDTTLRAICLCPECIEKAPIHFDSFEYKVVHYDNQATE